MSSRNASDFFQISGGRLELVAGCFQALADPTRLKILQALRLKEQSVQELVAQFNCSQPNVSRHLLILSKAGLVSKVKRGSHVFYRVAGKRVLALCDHVCAHVADVVANLQR